MFILGLDMSTLESNLIDIPEKRIMTAMKKFLTLAAVLFLTAWTVQAQKTMEGNEKSPLGDSGPCLVVEVEGQRDNVEDVMKDKFKKLKTGKKKGFVAMEKQAYDEISTTTIDLYYKVDKAGDNKSKVIMFLSTGYDNWMTAQTHSQEVSNAKAILDGLAREVRVYELNLAIEAQTKVVEGAVKEQEGLEKDLEKLEKDHTKLEEELAENKQDQETNKKSQEEQKKNIEEQKKLLDELQKQLGSVQ